MVITWLLWTNKLHAFCCVHTNMNKLWFTQHRKFQFLFFQIDKIEHNNNDISWLYDSLKTVLETCIAKHQLKSNYFLLKHHYMNLELTFPEVCLVDNLKKSIQYCMHLSAYLVVHHNTGACKPAANPTLWCIGCLVMTAICRLTMVMSWGFIRDEKYAWS